MIISKLNLQNFRNYKKVQFDFSEGTTVITGPNASGKSNILEAIYLLSTGKSFHARREEEMISYNSDIGRIVGEVDGGLWMVDSEKAKTQSTTHNSPITKLEVVLTRGTIDIGADRPERVPRKKLLVNGIGRHLYTFAGNLKVVLFGPWDMDIVTESPSTRRRFLDSVLSQVDREYRRSILSYEKGLRQRNRLLFKIREEGFSRNSLMFWDQLLIKAGNYITKVRDEFIEFVNNFPDPQGQDFSIEYDRSVISEGRLDQYKDEEVSAATTLVGPHRDDFIFKVKGKGQELKGKSRELARYGSRGEQRMGVLWLKLAELFYIEQKSNEKPVLLLDDIFSELDHIHRDVVVKIVKSSDQVIITTADEHFIQGFKSRNIIKLT
jgi:DNA replication and repair protein RecF